MKKTKKEKLDEFKREMILDAAWSVFTRKGFKEATMNDIAEEAQFALGTIYRIFKNKEDIFQTLLKLKLKGVHDIYLQSDDPSLNPMERIRIILKETYNYYHDNPQLLQILNFDRWVIDKEFIKNIRSTCKDEFTEMRSMIMDIVKNGIQEGYFREIESDRVALVLKGVATEFFWDSILSDEEIDIEELIDEILFMVMNGIGSVSYKKSNY